MIRIALIDDQPMFRQGIAMIVDSQPDMEVVGHESSALSLLDFVRTTRPDVVLMDVRMPVMDGVTLLKEITHRWDDIDVIMMSATESPAGLPVPPGLGARRDRTVAIGQGRRVHRQSPTLLSVL